MKKIYKLFVNENIKTWKKLSTKLLIIVLLLSLIASLGLVKLMKHLNSNIEYYDSTSNWREIVTEQKEEIKKSLNQNDLDEETRKNMNLELEKYDIALENDINIYSNYWKSDILDDIIALKQEDENNNEIEQLLQLIKNNDYSKYIELQKTIVKQSLDDKEISQQEYDDKMLVLDLKQKYEIGKEVEQNAWRKVVITSIEEAQKSLRTGVNQYDNRVLTIEQIKEKQDSIKINIYKLEKNMPPLEYSEENYRMVFESLAPGFVIVVLAIFVMIIAGGEISNECSTGTIKFWALTPNKRWKILTAKILSVFFYMIILTLIMSILTIICANVFFDNVGTEYVYVKDGNVKVINNTLYMIETYFVKIIPVSIFVLFAIMLSTITRNTSVAVSFSIATYVGNGIIMLIINQFIKKDWVRFIPFNNLNIYEKIFPNAESVFGASASTFATSTSLQFSLIVLGVCAVLMLVTMYDSFNNKDII